MPEPQSEAAPQTVPSLQWGAHPGGWHRPPVQCPEPQSASLPQFAPSPQVGAQAGA
jgi:hypothetical protein